MNEKPMKLWSISSVSQGRRHTAIVQETDMLQAIQYYCSYFAGQAEHMVGIEGQSLGLNRFDDFGKLARGIVAIPS